MSDKKRFRGSIRIHIGDDIYRQSIVLTSKIHSDSQENIIEKAIDDLKSILKSLEPINEKSLKEHIKNLIENKWSEKRIVNHFNKFDIDVNQYLNPQKKLIN